MHNDSPTVEREENNHKAMSCPRIRASLPTLRGHVKIAVLREMTPPPATVRHQTISLL